MGMKSIVIPSLEISLPLFLVKQCNKSGQCSYTQKSALEFCLSWLPNHVEFGRGEFRYGYLVGNIEFRSYPLYKPRSHNANLDRSVISLPSLLANLNSCILNSNIGIPFHTFSVGMWDAEISRESQFARSQ